MNPDFEMRGDEIYMDNAATTMVDEKVVEAMQPFLEERYGNPESPHHLGREAIVAVDTAREQIAELLRCLPEEIFFTSGGTEANNWAIKGFKYSEDHSDPKGLLVGAVEHASILKSALWATSAGICGMMGKAPVDKDSVIDMEDFKQNVGQGTGLVSIQYANNETGALQPVREIAEVCKSKKVVFHTDACQAYGKVKVDASADGFDMASLSSHKIHGPMGIGALFVRTGVPIEPLMHGGGHQGGMRSGTLPVPNIVGFGKAAEMAWSTMSEMKGVGSMMNTMGKDLELKCGVTINGGDNRLPNILSVTFPKAEAAVLCGILNRHGICVSTGSACRLREGLSHVLSEMGLTHRQNNSTLRISLSRYNTISQAHVVVGCIQGAIREEKERDLV